jgi:hypothetical protein
LILHNESRTAISASNINTIRELDLTFIPTDEQIILMNMTTVSPMKGYQSWMEYVFKEVIGLDLLYHIVVKFLD